MRVPRAAGAVGHKQLKIASAQDVEEEKCPRRLVVQHLWVAVGGLAGAIVGEDDLAALIRPGDTRRHGVHNLRVRDPFRQTGAIGGLRHVEVEERARVTEVVVDGSTPRPMNDNSWLRIWTKTHREMLHLRDVWRPAVAVLCR